MAEATSMSCAERGCFIIYQANLQRKQRTKLLAPLAGKFFASTFAHFSGTEATADCNLHVPKADIKHIDLSLMSHLENCALSPTST
jgi:hypothetical protein